MGKCGSCKFKGHCDTTSELYGVPKYNGGCQYYEKRSDYMKIIEVNPNIKALVDQNNGYCPCTILKNEDTKCMCKEFKEQKEPGVCHCGRFEKVKD